MGGYGTYMAQDERIRELISAYVDGEVTEDERLRAEAYIASSSEWRQYYEELLALRQTLQTLPRFTPTTDVAEYVIAKATRHAHTEPKPRVRPGRNPPWATSPTLWVMVTAGCVLLVGVIVYFGPMGSLFGPNGPTSHTQSVLSSGDKTRPDAHPAIPGTNKDVADHVAPATQGSTASMARTGSSAPSTTNPDDRSGPTGPQLAQSKSLVRSGRSESPESATTGLTTDRADQLPLTAMVIDLVLTDKGIREQVVDRAWVEVGIPSGQTIPVDAALEKALLGQRVFGGLGPEQLPAEGVGLPANVPYFQIFFIVATGRQIDAFLQRLDDLRATGDVSLVRLDLTMGTSDSVLFSALDRQARSRSDPSVASLVRVHPLLVDQQARQRLLDALRAAQQKQGAADAFLMEPPVRPEAEETNTPAANLDANLEEMEQLLFKVVLVVRSEATVRGAR